MEPSARINFPGLKVSPGRVIRSHLRASLNVYPHANDPVFQKRATDPIAISGESPKLALRKLSWTKQLGAAAGRWQAVVKEYKPSPVDMRNGAILPDDWARIVVERNGISIPICAGPIDTVSLDEQTSGGAIVRTWVLTGRDHGAAWEYPLAYQNIWIQTVSEVVQGLMTRKVGHKIGGNPSDMFETLIRAAFSRGRSTSSWQVPPSIDFGFFGSPLDPDLLSKTLSLIAASVDNGGVDPRRHHSGVVQPAAQ